MAPNKGFLALATRYALVDPSTPDLVTNLTNPSALLARSLNAFGLQYNREPLWPSDYAKTPTYQTIAVLNQFRNFLISKSANDSASGGWLDQNSTLVHSSAVDVVINKGGVISIMNTLGSPVSLFV